MSDITEREGASERQENRATRVNRYNDDNNNNNKSLVWVLFTFEVIVLRERDFKICFHFREQSERGTFIWTIMYNLHPPPVNQGRRFHRQRTK